MKKIAFGILIAVIAASPAAAAKKSKKQVQGDVPAFFTLNEAGFRFVRDSMPIYYPTLVKTLIYPIGPGNSK